MENAFSPGKECPKNNSTILCPLDAKIDHQSTMINVGLNCFSSPTRQIFTSSYGDTTITDEMLKIFAYTQHF